jgi:hypothetical protein
MGFFLTSLLVIGGIFAFLAWRMDRKHKSTAVLDRHTFDTEVAEAVFGNKHWDGSGRPLGH